MEKTKTTWRRVKLAEIADVRDGTHDTPKRQNLGKPLITSKQLKNGVILPTDYLISEEDFEFVNRRSKVDTNDVLISMIGTVGDTVFIKNQPNFAIKNIGLIKNHDPATGKFIFYWLNSPIGKEEVTKYLRGTSQRFLSLGSLRELEISIPDLSIQKQITDILVTYDDLIKNNTKRIKILEEIAQAIYREWFIYFHFPGYEKVKMIDSKTEFGKVPEGWEVKEITKFRCFKFSKPKMSRFESIKKYYATADIDTLGFVNNGEEVTFDSKPSRAQIQPDINSIWSARMKDTRKVVFFRNINSRIANLILLSSGMAGFQSENENFAFMFSLINSDFFHIQKNLNATGATQVSLTDEGLKQIKMVEPSIRLIQTYSQLINPGLDEILLLQAKNEILRQARDLLLPKLVTGEIRV